MLTKFKNECSKFNEKAAGNGTLHSGGNIKRKVDLISSIINDEVQSRFVSNKEIDDFVNAALFDIQKFHYHFNGKLKDKLSEELTKTLSAIKKKRSRIKTILSSNIFKFLAWLIPIIISIIALA